MNNPPCENYTLLVTGSAGIGLSDECSDVDLIFIKRDDHVIERPLLEKWISNFLSIPDGKFELTVIDEHELSAEYSRGDALAWCIFHTGQVLDYRGVVFDAKKVPSPFCGDSEFKSCIWSIVNYRPFQLRDYYLTWNDVFFIYAILRHYTIVSSSGILTQDVFTVRGLLSVPWLKEIEGFDKFICAVRRVKGGLDSPEHVPKLISAIGRCVVEQFISRYHKDTEMEREAQKRGARWILTTYAFSMASSACRCRWIVSGPLVNSNQSIKRWGQTLAKSYQSSNEQYFINLFENFLFRLCNSDPANWDKLSKRFSDGFNDD